MAQTLFETNNKLNSKQKTSKKPGTNTILFSTALFNKFIHAFSPNETTNMFFPKLTLFTIEPSNTAVLYFPN